MDFKRRLSRIEEEQYMLVEEATKYIEKKWKNVTDWQNLAIYISCSGSEIPREYHYDPNPSKTLMKLFKATPSIIDPNRFEIVIDELDRDVSLNVNGYEYLFISNDNIITIAQFISETRDRKLKFLEV